MIGLDTLQGGLYSWTRNAQSLPYFLENIQKRTSQISANLIHFGKVVPTQPVDWALVHCISNESSLTYIPPLTYYRLHSRLPRWLHAAAWRPERWRQEARNVFIFSLLTARINCLLSFRWTEKVFPWKECLTDARKLIFIYSKNITPLNRNVTFSHFILKMYGIYVWYVDNIYCVVMSFKGDVKDRFYFLWTHTLVVHFCFKSMYCGNGLLVVALS